MVNGKALLFSRKAEKFKNEVFSPKMRYLMFFVHIHFTEKFEQSLTAETLECTLSHGIIKTSLFPDHTKTQTRRFQIPSLLYSVFQNLDFLVRTSVNSRSKSRNQAAFSFQISLAYCNRLRSKTRSSFQFKDYYEWCT